MKVIVGNRGSGKTRKLVELSARMNRTILVASKELVRTTFQMAQDLGLDISMPMTYNEFMNAKQDAILGKKMLIEGVILDDANVFVEYMLRSPVIAMAVTSNDAEVKMILPEDRAQEVVLREAVALKPVEMSLRYATPVSLEWTNWDRSGDERDS